MEPIVRNQSYVEPVRTLKNDCSKVEGLLSPNLHNNTYPTNMYPNNPYPYNPYPNNTHSNNIYPKLHNTFSDGKIKYSTINLYYKNIHYININSYK